MADSSVRPARAGDAEALADVQVRTWRAAYADLLPEVVLRDLAETAAADSWRAAIADPPGPRHRVLVAAEGERPVGFAALAPAGDPPGDAPGPETGRSAATGDADPADLLLLLVTPEAQRRGHGSRLLAAAVDVVRAAGGQTAVSWVLADDTVTRGFLESAGWAADGATRDLDMGRPVRQVRLHTDVRP